jgi:hypothetical protein
MAEASRKSNPVRQAALASYLEAMAEDLAQLARRNGLDALGYLFELARLEAENIQHQSDGLEG